MATPTVIELPGAPPIPILHEDRGCVVIDKPAGWLVVPADWDRTSRNLQRELEAAIARGAFWARSRNLRFLRFVHRLDAETSGVLLLAKSPGAVAAYGALFEHRATLKEYLAVVAGKPPRRRWTCCLKIRPDPDQPDRMLTDTRIGREARTDFEVVTHADGTALVLACPRTGRTHQIRVHLAAAGLAVVGDRLYGFGRKLPSRGQRRHWQRRLLGSVDLRNSEATLSPPAHPPAGRGSSRSLRDAGDLRAEQSGQSGQDIKDEPAGIQRRLALRAVRLAFECPFSDRPVDISAPTDQFLADYGFATDTTGYADGALPNGP